jgi:thymidylate synthase ThyX
MRQDTDDGLNPGQLLIEAAGRACYRSWEEGLNPNVKRIRRDQKEYFLNLLRSGHGSVLEHSNYSFIIWDVSRVFCYDDDTEVLTSDGWIPWPKIDGSERFGTLNPESNELEFQSATERFIADYSGPMYRVQSEQVDLLVTPNHRMWVQKHDTQAAKRKEEAYKVYLPKDILGKRVKYKKAARWVGQYPEFVQLPPAYRGARRYSSPNFPSGPFARFLGYYLAEGYINEHRIVLCQNRGPVLNRMAQTVEDMGLHPYVVPEPHQGKVVTGCTPLRDFLLTAGPRAIEKRVPPIVGSWAPELIREFLQAMVEGDGCTHPKNGHQIIYTASKEMADDLQVLAIKAGWSANVRIDDRVGLRRQMPNGQVFHNLRPCYIVSLVKRRTHPLVNHNGARNDGFIHYEGKIHCVKVPNGLLFVRRNGKPVVSGNTHELVRHRAGSAFSQESLRFVRLEEIPFRIPDVLEALRPQIISILETLDEFQISASEHFGLDEEGVDFHKKKTITSALRRLAPEGLSTMIIWTANVRTLRHVIQARTDPGAEEELRLVFNRIGEIMVAEAPLLFGDFVVNDGAWVTDYRKV